MSWIKRLAVAFVGTAMASTAIVGTPISANAEEVTIVDPTGDTAGAGLDITNVSLRNEDHAVVAVMRFERDRRGEIIVGVRARGHGLIARMVSIHRLHGADRVFLLTGAGETPCKGLRSTWNREAAKVRLRLPSTCLLGGDYGAIRGWFLIEGFGGGGDIDYAPDEPDGNIGWTSWVSRG